MVGHRTRLVQQAPERWHEGEEELLSTYARLGRDMDRRLTALLALAPRGWMVVAVAGLGVEMARGTSSAEVAVGAGGILLALSALTRLVNGLAQVGDAAVAWSQVAPLFDAAARTSGGRTAETEPPEAGGTGPLPALVETEDLAYHCVGREGPALAGCTLRIDRNDRVLLEGPSGSGKSTLAALLSGLRQPTSGRLCFDGAEQASVGVPAWRRHVVAAPQFHENHVVLGPLAFNLLLGRRWPPQPEDLQDAYEVCIALGLGPLLERMPAGLQQMVCDTGWQLSHGERSLVFLGRALLQGADLVLLDETFGSLDPATMHRALRLLSIERRPWSSSDNDFAACVPGRENGDATSSADRASPEDRSLDDASAPSEPISLAPKAVVTSTAEVDQRFWSRGDIDLQWAGRRRPPPWARQGHTAASMQSGRP